MNAQEKYEQKTSTVHTVERTITLNISAAGDEGNVLEPPGSEQHHVAGKDKKKEDKESDGESSDDDDGGSGGGGGSGSGREEGKRKKSLVKKQEELFEREETKFKRTVETYMEEGKITEGMAQALMKKKHLEVYDDDDDDIKAYKIELNVKLKLARGSIGEGGSRTNPDNDCRAFWVAGIFLGAYYGACVWMLTVGKPVYTALAAILGVGAPGFMCYLVSSWRKAKRENKRALWRTH